MFQELVYLDNILVFSRSDKEHVLQVFVKAEKCEFHRSTISFQGHVNTEGNVQMVPENVRAVVEWPQLTPRV